MTQRELLGAPVSSKRLLGEGNGLSARPSMDPKVEALASEEKHAAG